MVSGRINPGPTYSKDGPEEVLKKVAAGDLVERVPQAQSAIALQSNLMPAEALRKMIAQDIFLDNLAK